MDVRVCINWPLVSVSVCQAAGDVRWWSVISAVIITEEQPSDVSADKTLVYKCELTFRETCQRPVIVRQLLPESVRGLVLKPASRLTAS